MQWDDSEHAGFTDGEPWLPVNTNYEQVNAAAAREGDSVREYYRSLIDLRTEYDAFVYGSYEDLHPDHERLAAYTQTLEHNGGVSERILSVLNFSDDTEPVDIPTTVENGELLLSNYDRDAISPTRDHEPYEARIFRLE